MALSNDGEMPLYLAVVAESQQAQPQVFNFINQSFATLEKIFPQDKELFGADFSKLTSLQALNAPWQLPDSWHSTVLYVGGNTAQLETPYYTQFKEGKDIELLSYTFVYVPERIICSPVFPQGVLMSNACPHVTLMMGAWGAVASNYVLEALFTNGGPLQQEYQSGFFLQQDASLVRKYTNMSINGETVDVYIIKISPEDSAHIDLDGIETKVYSLQSANTTSLSSK